MMGRRALLCLFFISCYRVFLPDFPVRNTRELMAYNRFIQEALKAHHPRTRDDLRMEVKDHVVRLLEMARIHYGVVDKEVTFVIKWDLVDARSGSAWCENNHAEIHFNEVLFLLNYDRFFRDDIPHEVAHVVASCLLSPMDDAHGSIWFEVATFLSGRRPKTTHNYDLDPIHQLRDAMEKSLENNQ